jgi:hypothetical protein
MSALAEDVAQITRHIRNLRGGSGPILAQASDGQLYVVKFINNLQGFNLLFNEGMGSELYQAYGLMEPAWRPLLLTDAFIDQNPECWMNGPEGSRRPEAGLCFASRYLGEAEYRLLEILPGGYLNRIRNRSSFWLAWLVDICASHTDNRQTIFREDCTGKLDAFFVDHGHLFGGPLGEERRHFQASRYLDARIYPAITTRELKAFQKTARGLNAEQLWRRMQKLPEEWKTPSAVKNFSLCLDRLATSSLLQNIFDTMLDAQQRSQGYAMIPPPEPCNPPAAVLTQCMGRNRYNCTACA